jgi:hypothetical protein
MAIIQPSITPVSGQTNIDGVQVVWAGMHNGDVGAAVGSTIGFGASAVSAPGGGFVSGFADKSVQVAGTFGAGGNVAVEGNNDGGATFYPLTDPLMNTIAITQAGPFLKEIMEAVIQVRPHVTVGDGTTSLTVTMWFRKTSQP